MIYQVIKDEKVTVADFLLTCELKAISDFYVLKYEDEEAIEKMKTALDTTIIKGVKTNILFLSSILDEPIFKEGTYNNHYVTDRLNQALSII